MAKHPSTPRSVLAIPVESANLSRAPAVAVSVALSYLSSVRSVATPVPETLREKPSSDVAPFMSTCVEISQ